MKFLFGEKFIKGKYFFYCQWCRFDGHCRLRHYQFMGVKSSGKIDRTSYPGHEDVVWHQTAAQHRNPRASCNGRIYYSTNLFIPLMCECGTAITSLALAPALGGRVFCAKFQPNKKGKERLRIAEKIAKDQGIDISQVSSKDLPRPDPKYQAVMHEPSIEEV